MLINYLHKAFLPRYQNKIKMALRHENACNRELRSSSKNPHAIAQRRRSISCIRFSTSAQRRRALQRSAAELMHSKGELEGSRRRRVAITVRLRCCYASGAALQRAGDRTRAPLCLIDWLRPHATTKSRAGCVGAPEIWVLRRRRSAAAGKEERRSCLSLPSEPSGVCDCGALRPRQDGGRTQLLRPADTP